MYLTVSKKDLRTTESEFGVRQVFFDADEVLIPVKVFPFKI